MVKCPPFQSKKDLQLYAFRIALCELEKAQRYTHPDPKFLAHATRAVQREINRLENQL